MNTLPGYVFEYFKGEKTEMIAIMLVSGMFIAFSLWALLFTKDGFLKGLSIPLVVLSLVLSGVAVSIYIRTPPQLERLEMTYRNDIPEFKKIETERMGQVLANYKYYIGLYVFFIAAGLALVFMTSKGLYRGIAIGLMLMALYGFVIDHYSENRAIRYYQKLLE